MARQQVQGDQIEDGTIQKKDIDISTAGQAVITKILGSEGIEIVSSTGADAGTGEVSLKVSGGFGTQYYAFQTLAEQLTVSDLWVEAAAYTTGISIPSGKYILHYKAQVTNSSKKPVGFQVEVQEDALPFVVVEESTKSPSTANIYETRSGFEEITVSADNVVNIAVNFGQTTAGGTGKIRRIAIYLFRVGDI